MNHSAVNVSGASHAGATPAVNRYDPAYDPLLDATPGQGCDYAPTYWIGTGGELPADDGPVQGDMDADVVIIGAGFTGLTAAIALARDHGIKAVVLEANRGMGVQHTQWGAGAMCLRKVETFAVDRTLGA